VHWLGIWDRGHVLPDEANQDHVYGHENANEPGAKYQLPGKQGGTGWQGSHYAEAICQVENDRHTSQNIAHGKQVEAIKSELRDEEGK
jgi:hypothetical protein